MEAAMTTESNGTRVPFEPEDLARVRRLTEEAKGRLHEIGLIMARTLGHSADPVAVRYETRRDSAADEPTTIDVVIILLPDGTFCCTQDPPGVCICPC
jgi:hypothetical protein